MLHEPQTLQEAFVVGGPVMWPLLGASVVAVAVIVERAVTYGLQRLPFEPFVEQLCQAVRADDRDAAERIVEDLRQDLHWDLGTQKLAARP